MAWKPPIPRAAANSKENAIGGERVFGNARNVEALSQDSVSFVPQSPTPIREAKGVKRPTAIAPSKVDSNSLKPVDEEHLAIQRGDAIKIDNSNKGDFYTADGDTYYDNATKVWNPKDGKWNNQGYREANVDATDDKSLPEYQRSKQFNKDWVGDDKVKYLVPTGAVDQWGRKMVIGVKYNLDGTLEKSDSLKMAFGQAGAYAFHPGEPNRVLEMTTERMKGVQAKYPQTNKITLDNAAYRAEKKKAR